MRSVAVALGILLLAACGGLETPVASVSGRIVGASAGGYAYPLGRPDLKTALADDGSFAFEAVPTSVHALVLYDGADRAELVAIRLEGALDHRVADRFGSAASVAGPLKMPLAGRVVAAALPTGGAIPRDPTFSVLETDHEALRPASGDVDTVTLYPLPPGRFDVTGAALGYRKGRVAIQVIAGASVPAQLLLDVDAADTARGCASSTGCKNDLHCNALDGRCYACVVDVDCEDDERCDTAVGLCGPITGPAAESCASCRNDADCDAAAGYFCASGYCTPLCAAGCPAGFECGDGGRCRAPEGCAHWLQTMGTTCLDDEPCRDDLTGGRCEAVAGTPGFCTAPCSADADCRIGLQTALFTCVGAPTGHCAPP